VKLADEIELTPHTGRRAWATYQAESGTPLPLLSSMLGHKNQKTTAEYYWKNIYKDKDINNILCGQKYTEKLNIFSPVKNRNFWREYNATRKDYIRRKNKERCLKNKKIKERNKMKEINTIKNTTEEVKTYQLYEPTKSRLLISR
jgi:hypothetical protein